MRVLRLLRGSVTLGCTALLCVSGFAADSVPLTVPPGSPLRLYLTKKVPKRAAESVEAKLLDPVYAFDREVVPAGALVRGSVNRVQPATKWQRLRAILGGDFTPLREARFQFTTLLLPDGRSFALHTAESTPLDSIVSFPASKPKKPAKSSPAKPGKGGAMQTAKRTARSQINSQIDAQINRRTMGIGSIIRGPNKKERLYDLLVSKLPYHPQYVRRGTRVDADLIEALAFGSESPAPGAMALLGSQPEPDSQVRARLLTPLDSRGTRQGAPIEAVIAAPVFSRDARLVLPEGTRLKGEVVLARHARWFHRGGQLRFNFREMDLPPQAARFRAPASNSRTMATLGGAEASGPARVKVDEEGGVKTVDSKARLIAPLISVLIANKSLDNDSGRGAASGGANGNVTGRTLGGFSGFGMAGSLAGQSSKYVGTAFGIYGMALSIYTNVVAKGSEVQFGKNAMIDIKFGALRGRRVPAPVSAAVQKPK